jgi:ribonuclease Y
MGGTAVNELVWYLTLCGLTAFVTFVCLRIWDFFVVKGAKARAREIISRAEQEAENRRRETEVELKELALRYKEEAEQEFRKIREELHHRQRLLDKRQDALDEQSEQLRKQERVIENLQRKLAEKIQEYNRLNEDREKVIALERQRLHEISGLSKEEATKRLLELLEKELQQEVASVVLRHEKKLVELCEEKTREILLSALQRYAAAHTAEATTSVVDIPNEEMKGRIIGREGRNIRAFERVTGTELIIDDTPGVVVVSCFDPIRREVARLSLMKLIADGRIHPSRIEEVVKETEKELEDHILRLGQEACQEVGVSNIHEQIVRHLGRLNFRTSYSQNVLRHSLEVAFIAGMIAEELGYNGALARRCGLLHDIGKAADHEVEGGHPKIGGELLRRFGEPPEVVHAAESHHDSFCIQWPYTAIVAAADACSAARPGARRETLEKYLKRMQELEQIASEFPGVEQAYAIQAGREMRVILKASETTDEMAAKICHDIARAYENRLNFPGEIKVTVVRETRFTEIAR